jgi:hypothetical protein
MVLLLIVRLWCKQYPGTGTDDPTVKIVLSLHCFRIDFDADPDPAFDLHADKDPDSAFSSDEDPDPASQHDPDPLESATLVSGYCYPWTIYSYLGNAATHGM